MQKRISFILILFFLNTFCIAQPTSWTKGMGSPVNDFGLDITVDSIGNIYTTGYFGGTVDFDPGNGVFNLTALGTSDIFIQKLDPDGNFLWAISFGNEGNIREQGSGIAIDHEGNIIIMGSFHGTVDFDPSTNVSNLENETLSLFILKLDPNGNFLWAKGLNNLTEDGHTQPEDLVLDDSSNIYITGMFWGTLDFNPNPILTDSLTSNGISDAFVMKLDHKANLIWAKSTGNNYWDYGVAIAVDQIGNVYTIGEFNDTLDIDPSNAIFELTSNGHRDVYIQKLDPDGNFIWAKSMGGSRLDRAGGIGLDQFGNIYTAGHFRDTVDFDTGVDSFHLIADGAIQAELFFQKLNPAGDFVWAKKIGSSGADFLGSLLIDSLGNIYATGSYQDTVDFDPGPAIFEFNTFEENDFNVFFLNLNTDGDFVWAKEMGINGSGYGYGIGLSLDQNNNFYATGRFNSTLYYNNMNILDSVDHVGYADIFVHKMENCPPSFGVDTVSACENYTWIDGNTYTSSNSSATFLLVNTAGCDSIVTLNLTIQNSTGFDEVFACDSFTWIDGNTYNSNNNSATFVLTNAAGCDSIVTLNLTIQKFSTIIDEITACHNYTWIDGNNYTSSNNSATFILTNAAGCDSTVILNLTINTVNVDLTVEEHVLTSNLSGATYQWLDCNDNYAPIIGEFYQNYIATTNGSYAVEIADNNCVDTSACIEVSSLVSISSIDLKKNISIAPNPNNGIFFIQTSSNIKLATYYISDHSGKQVFRGDLNNITNEVNLSHLTSGFYFICISFNEGELYCDKIIIANTLAD